MIPLSTLALIVKTASPGAKLVPSRHNEKKVFQIRSGDGKAMSGWHTTERYAWEEARRRLKKAALKPGV